MTDELKKAYYVLLDFARKGLQLTAETETELQNNTEQYRTARSIVETAFSTDKTLEIVKAMREKVNQTAHTKTKFSERKWWLACVGVLEEIIREATK